MLIRRLRRDYPEDHPVTLYEASHYPVCDPLIQRAPLGELSRCRITTHSTLWVPPVGKAPLDREVATLLGVPIREEEP